MHCLLYILSLIIYHSNANQDVSDIEDYQFHFSTFHYTFNIQSLSAIIQHPFDPQLNITLDIDFNKTISLSINNITLDFFNIDDFSEITYTSSIHDPNPSSHRNLLSYPKTPIIKGNYNDLYKVFEKQAQDAVRKQTAKAAIKSGKETTDKSGMPQDLHSLEDQVSHSIHKEILENSQDEWRNRMFDQSMGNGPHPGFPTRNELEKYRAYNHNPPPIGYDKDYDKYREMRKKALQRGDELYDKMGNMPLHDAESLKKRYSPRNANIKHGEYPETPPETPRSVPYHHGKYIGIPKRKSWFMAQQHCREQYGTNLASVMNEEELNEIRHVCDEVAGYGHCWIGLRRPFGTWMDGWPVVMDNWGENGVNNLHEVPLNCVEILHQDKIWNAQLCTVTRSFVCESARKRTRGKYIAVGKTLSWSSAENYCQETYNTQLASITTEKENRLAMNLCRDINSDMHHCWVGLYAPFNVWTDDIEAEYTNFNTFKEQKGDHNGVGVFENGKGEPEPYGEDEEANYPKAMMMDGGDDLKINDAINKDVDRLMTKVRRHADPPEGKKEEDDNKGKLYTPQDNRKEMEKRADEIDKEENGGEEEEEDGNDKCVQINTSYGGVWDKARCSFRHFFMCNTPGYNGREHHNKKKGAREEEREEEREYYRGEREKEKKKKRKKKRKKRRNEREERASEREEEEGERRRLIDEFNFKGLASKAKGLWAKHGDKVMAAGQKAMGAMGGRGGGSSAETSDRRHKRDSWRNEHEGNSRWKRRERRRRRRKKRRRRFKHWLKKHYGRGVRRRCQGRCPHRHIHIRTLPKDMHWSPLSGLLPMFGVEGFHMMHPKKGPKIHIVAKVHLPKHRPIEGDLDYTLLNALLFNDEDKVRKQGSHLMDKFDEKEKKIEKLITGENAKNMMNDFNNDNNMEEHFNEERMYKKWDEQNDDRFAQNERRRLTENDGGINMVKECIIYDNKYDICVSYDIDNIGLSVDIKSLEYKMNNKRRVFRDIMRLNNEHYADYDVIEYESMNDDYEYGLFESIDGNLGFAIFKYESMDWHSVKEFGDNKFNYKYKYGDYDNFKHFIRFNQRFELVLSDNNNDECSVPFDGLPFKLCVFNGIGLYFEFVNSLSVFDPIFSFRMKQFIDFEFKNSIFNFDDNNDWDQINIINMNQMIEKCSYLHIAKVCMKQNNDDETMTASIIFQFVNKKRSILN